MTRICVYSFANYGRFLKHVIKNYSDSSKDTEWSVITNNFQALKQYDGIISKEKVKYLFENFNEVFKKTSLEEYNDIKEMYSSKSSLWRALIVDKVSYKKMDKEFQIRHGISVYKIYKQFLLELKPQYVFFPLIESHDAFILYDICIELGIEPIVYSTGRNIGGSFLTDSFQDYLPKYADTLQISEATFQRAKTFLENYRSDFVKVKYGIIEGFEESEKIPIEKIDNVFIRLINNIKVTRGKEKYNLYINFRTKFLVFFQKYNFKYLQFKYKKQQRNFDIKSIEQLPDNFVYYPLQFSPESSINVPSPFYIDQFRVIDELLLKFCNGRYLLVKEHPAMMGERSNKFYKELTKKPGVLTVDARVPSSEITKRATMVASVTGTAVLEAFLYGRPVLMLGETTLKPYLVKEHFESYDDLEIIDFIAKVMECCGNYVLITPGAYGINSAGLFNKLNVNNFCAALKKHIFLAEAFNKSFCKEE